MNIRFLFVHKWIYMLFTWKILENKYSMVHSSNIHTYYGKSFRYEIQWFLYRYSCIIGSRTTTSCLPNLNHYHKQHGIQNKLLQLTWLMWSSRKSLRSPFSYRKLFNTSVPKCFSRRSSTLFVTWSIVWCYYSEIFNFEKKNGSSEINSSTDFIDFDG